MMINMKLLLLEMCFLTEKISLLDIDPLELFSKETIDSLDTRIDTASKSNQYVDASNFRREPEVTTETSVIPVHPIPEPPRASPLPFQPEGLGLEYDKAYFSTL